LPIVHANVRHLANAPGKTARLIILDVGFLLLPSKAHQCSEKAQAQPVGNLIDSASEYRAFRVFGLQTNRSCLAGQALFARKNGLIRKPRIAPCACPQSFPCHKAISLSRVKVWARITPPRSRSHPHGSNPRARRIACTASA